MRGMEKVNVGSQPSGKENNSQNSNTNLKAMKMPLLSDLRPNDKCHCCPYGYHIDLDFVRYCEALANGTYLRQLKQLKRNRRRQRKSMEALLNNQEGKNAFEDDISRGKMIDNASGPPPDLVNTSEALRDALKEAMLDFEEILQKSETTKSEQKKHLNASSSPNVPSIDLLTSTNICLPSERDTPHFIHGNEVKLQPTQLFSPNDSFPNFSGSRSRSGSASSLTSTSTVSSYTDQNGATLPALPSQQIADTMATLNNSVLLFSPLSGGHSGTLPDSTSSTSVVSMNREALHSIREQMAASLQRMRELEEHVKSIPILQVKLSVLKEEKRLLMLQLKAKASKLDHRSVGVGISPSHSLDMSIDEMGRRLDQLGAMGITSPRPRRKMLSESRIRSRSESPVFRNKSTLIDLTDFHSHKRACPSSSVSPEDEICSLLEQVPKTDLYLRETRSIGVNCAVLTRDVGISHIVPPSKSVATNNIQTDESFVCKKCSNKKSDRNEMKSKVVCLKCFEREQKSFDDASISTDLLSPKKDLVLSLSPCHIESFSPTPCRDCLERRTKQMISLAVSTTDLNILADEESDNLEKEMADNAVNTELVNLKNSSINTEKIRTHNFLMNTDLYMDDIINREEYESMISLNTPLHLNPEMVEKAIQAKIDKTTSSSSAQAVLEDFDLKATPIRPKVTTRSFGTITKHERLVDKGIGFNSVNEIICDRCQKLSRRNIGVGDLSVNDVLCDKCLNKHSRTVACGDHKVSNVICDKCSGIKQRTIGCGLSTISDNICQRCDNLQTVSIGVGNASINQLLCLSCLQRRSKNVSVGTTQHPQTKSVETNTHESETSKRQLSKTSIENGNVSVCDKCSSTIHSVASDFVQKAPPSYSNPPPPLPSRIPRLTMITATDSISTVNTSNPAHLPVNPKSRIAVSSSKITSRSKTVQLKNESNQSLPEFGGDVYVNKGFENFLLMKESSKTLKNAKYETKSHSVDESDSSDSSDSDSSDSPDEGSYDGVYGNIVHTCHDDEAIRQGLPGASMFQPIQDKKENPINSLNEELLKACQILNDHLNKPNQSQSLTKEVNSSFNTIQQEWFRVSSQKGANAHLVEEYMDAFEDMSPKLLDKIVNMADANGNTSMHYAVSHGNFDVVSLLLDSKVCDVNKQNKAGYTCIMLASLAQLGEPSDRCVLQRLFKLGDVNIKASQHGQTALMLAVSHGRLDIVKMLLEAGAAVNIQDEDGSTALMCAGEHGYTEIVRTLLNHPDCDPTLKDNDNCTALAIAMEAGHKDIGVLIYAHTSLSRGSSPHSSTRGKRRNVIPSSSTPPPRTPPPPSPALSRKSTMSVP